MASRKKFIEQLRGIVKFAIDVQQQSASDDERAIMAANVQQIFAGLTKLSNEARHRRRRRGAGGVQQGHLPGLRVAGRRGQ